MNNKRYDDALKRAEAILKVAQNQTEIYNCIITIFPELKESEVSNEDEKIRRAIIEGLKEMKSSFHTISSIKIDDAIAWLEKQGKQKVADKVEAKQNSDIEKGKWYVCDTHQYSDFTVGKVYYCPKNGMLKPNENEMARYVSKYCFHLWTIQDAKDGDVLATSAGAFIYNGNDGGGSCPGSYCGINTLGKFQIGVEKHWTGKKVYPATKEQCNTLEKAMADAGYIFNVEKKEIMSY